MAVGPEAMCDLLFTSGTTGKPKGVMSGHGQNLRAFTEYVKVIGLVPEDRYLIVNPFFHAFGYKAGWLTCLIGGATILPHAVFDAEQVFQRIARERISVPARCADPAISRCWPIRGSSRPTCRACASR